MKKALKSIAFALFSAAMLFNFAACSSDDDSGSDDGGSTTVKLPESVGENPFKGKTLKDYGKSYKFSDKTVDETDGSYTETYGYTYNAETSVIYLKLKKVSMSYGGKTYSYSSANDYVKQASKLGNLSADELEYYKAQMADDFATIKTYKYTITDDSIDLEKYFDGQLPTEEKFYTTYDTEIKGVTLKGTCLNFNEGYTEWHEAYLNFSNDSFTGTIFEVTYSYYSNDAKKLGTIKGTYTLSSEEGKNIYGDAVTDWYLTLKLTEVPEGLESYKDKEIKLHYEQE